MSDPIERLRAVLAAATPGPWEAEHPYGPPHGWVISSARHVSHPDVCRGAGREDREAISALGTLWPALLAVVEAAVEVADHRGRCATLEGGRAHSQLAFRLADLDAAIAAALPEEP